MTFTPRTCAIAALIALLSACGSAPKDRFYTLSEGASSELGSLPGLDYGVVVGPVSIPDRVDRPQFVLRVDGSEVKVAEQVRWAEPLKEGIAHAFSANIAQGLNNARVSTHQQSGAGDPDYRVIIDVQRFDSALGESATLEVMWTVRRVKDGRLQTGRARVREPVDGQGYHDLVTAHGRAIGAVSRNIVDAIRSSRQRDVAAAPSAPVQ